MSGEIIFLIVVLVVFAAMIGCVELWDGREEHHHKSLLKDSVRCTGVITKIERRGLLESRGAYPWRVEVAFVYEEKRYLVAQKCTSKPEYMVGDRVSVLIDVSDPSGSVIIIE